MYTGTGSEMEPAILLSLFACGAFFLVGLVTGVWKYVDMVADPESQAHYYINTAHRASLLYSFAALVLIQFVLVSPYTETTNLVAVALPLFFFGFAIATYIVHGTLKDTDNQFQPPYRIGNWDLSPRVLHGSMLLLILAEIGGFLVV